MNAAALPGLVMVASGVACLGGAVVGRSRIGIAAATTMLFAMLDLAFERRLTALDELCADHCFRGCGQRQ